MEADLKKAWCWGHYSPGYRGRYAKKVATSENVYDMSTAGREIASSGTNGIA